MNADVDMSYKMPIIDIERVIKHAIEHPKPGGHRQRCIEAYIS